MEESTAILMEEELYRAAIVGDTTIFQKYDTSYFTNQTTPKRNNVIHIAAEYDQYNFIQTAITLFPELIFGKNINKDTPLHVAARKGHRKMVELLVSWSGCGFMKSQEDWLWAAKNSQGDTPLHCALSNNKLDVGMDLVRVSSYKALSFLNKNQETPLHIFLRYCSGCASEERDPPSYMKEMLGEFLKYKAATCIPDVKGLTPLLIAAEQGFLEAVKLIVSQCSQSVEICDSEGRTVLHCLKIFSNQTNTLYKEFKELLQIPEINAIKNHKDYHGNTAVHAALQAKAFVLVRVLASCSADFKIKNRNGVSALDIIKSLPDLPLQLKEVKEEVLVAQKKLKVATLCINTMEADIYKAAVDGDCTLFGSSRITSSDNVLESNDDGGGSHHVVTIGEANNDTKFLSHTPGGSNILHIAIRHYKELFIEEAIKRYPELIFEVDCNGDTPLHIAAKYYKTGFSKLIGYIKDHCLNVEQEERIRKPWIAKNSKGNTPLHEAFVPSQETWSLGTLRDVEALISLDPDMIQFVNDAGETPLHILAKYEDTFGIENILKLLLSDDKSTGYIKDNEGLTPLLRAAKSGRFYAAQVILEHCPQSIELRDNRGRSFLHLLNLTPFENNYNISDDKFAFKRLGEPLFEIPEVDFLRNVQDFDGNTPLHLAIKDGDSLKVMILAKRIREASEDEFINALYFRNKEGQHVIDLLATHDDAPNEILQMLYKKSIRLKMLWIRSSYGICKSQIKETTNTLSVVAALLATLTFAAAFQVPGGYKDNGTPILLKDPAFKVFKVSNTCAMCGSMTVLFALLWVITTGKRTDSLILLDLSITLLMLSFYATLVAFMSGVYAVTSPDHKAVWVAIFAIILSSTVIVFTRKNIVLRVTRCCYLMSILIIVIRQKRTNT